MLDTSRQSREEGTLVLADDEEPAEELPSDLQLWVIMVRPPSDVSSDFVGIEDQHGHIRGMELGISWRQRPDRLWALGPFRPPCPRERPSPTG
jgi:hypothetical protein